MPSKPRGDRPLTLAGRSALFRQRRKEREQEMDAAFIRIRESMRLIEKAKTLREVREIAAEFTQGRPK